MTQGCQALMKCRMNFSLHKFLGVLLLFGALKVTSVNYLLCMQDLRKLVTCSYLAGLEA